MRKAFTQNEQANPGQLDIGPIPDCKHWGKKFTYLLRLSKKPNWAIL